MFPSSHLDPYGSSEVRKDVNRRPPRPVQESAPLWPRWSMVLAGYGPGFSQPSDTRERAAGTGRRSPGRLPPFRPPIRRRRSRGSLSQQAWPHRAESQTLVDRGRPAGQFARGAPAHQGDAGACEARARADAVAERSGTFGLETETKVKSTEFPDGRRAPGAETTTQRPPSYFGLSISVPTNDKSIIPAIPAPFGKSE